MLEEIYLESVSHMHFEIEAESELYINEPDSALEFEDSDTDLASEYSTDLVKVRQYKSQEYDIENGYKITEHDDVSEEYNLLSSRKEVTKTLVDHYKILKIFVVGFPLTPTPNGSWAAEAFSLCVLLLPNLREVPHGTKGTGPKFVTRPVYLRSQLRNNTNTVLL